MNYLGPQSRVDFNKKTASVMKGAPIPVSMRDFRVLACNKSLNATNHICQKVQHGGDSIMRLRVFLWLQ